MISPHKDFECANCRAVQGDWLTMEDSGPICMVCAEMDHLAFLPSGDAALTRRARAASKLSAVVIRWSRARKRYERQGLLVEESALDQAEAQCLADEDVRARRRERAAAQRVVEDANLHEEMAAEITRLFPGCPIERAQRIARHAGARGSGRVGRSAAGRSLDAHALELAVVAAIRHEDTRYDDLLMSGVDRADAREQVGAEVFETLERWRAG